MSYSLLVFVIEALANDAEDYKATWEDFRGQQRQEFDLLLEDERVLSIESSWIEDLRNSIVNVLHPGATRRFTQFAINHIPDDFYHSSNNTSKRPLRRSRTRQAIQNAYVLRSSFSHALTPLTTFLIRESYRAEEVNQGSQTYLTLRGLFRLVRSVILVFIVKLVHVALHNLPWHIDAHQHGLVKEAPVPAYLRLKDPEGKLHKIEAQYAKYWLEDILVIFQDNYVERLHEKLSLNQTDSDWFMGIATSGPRVGEGIFRFDPNPSYEWSLISKKSLALIPQAKKSYKGYLQSITLLCAHLEEMDCGYSIWNSLLESRAFGKPLFGLERFVVDVIHDELRDWSSVQAESLFEKHLKKNKISMPSRVEIACMLAIAKLFKREGSNEGRKKWLTIAHGDSALYPKEQKFIQNA